MRALRLSEDSNSAKQVPSDRAEGYRIPWAPIVNNACAHCLATRWLDGKHAMECAPMERRAAESLALNNRSPTEFKETTYSIRETRSSAGIVRSFAKTAVCYQINLGSLICLEAIPGRFIGFLTQHHPNWRVTPRCLHCNAVRSARFWPQPRIPPAPSPDP